MTKPTTEPAPIATTAQQSDLETRRTELFTLLVALNANTAERPPEVRNNLKARLSELVFERCASEPDTSAPRKRDQS